MTVTQPATTMMTSVVGMPVTARVVPQITTVPTRVASVRVGGALDAAGWTGADMRDLRGIRDVHGPRRAGQVRSVPAVLDRRNRSSLAVASERLCYPLTSSRVRVSFSLLPAFVGPGAVAGGRLAPTP